MVDECLKHSYYTRVGLSFSRLFYSNFIVNCGQAPDLVFCLDTGTFEQKEQLLEAFLEQWGPRQESGCHVTTSPRRDVPTSRRLNVATSARDLHLII